MLTCLRVRNFAIIEALELDLGPGLNIVTGETGAGKSILIDALDLVLGARGKADVVRGGTGAAEVEALFELSNNPDVFLRLEEAGFPVEDELIIRRVINATGRTRAYVNGRLATQGQLRVLASGLADISSQHEHHTLVEAANHLAYLDAFAGIEQEVAEMGEAFEALLGARRAREELQDAQRNRNDREDLLRFQLTEIDELSPVPGEDEALLKEQSKLRNAEELAAISGEAQERLYDADDAICTEVARIAAKVEQGAELDSALAEPAKQLSEVQAQLEDAAAVLGRYARDLVFDPERLATIDDRLSELHRLKRKHGGHIEHVLAYREQAAAELANLDAMEERLQEAEAACQHALEQARIRALAIRKRRKRAAASLGKSISEELATLGMGDARVVVELATLDHRAEHPTVDGARLSAKGIDHAEFLIAPNRGEEAKPLRQIASGGELSRALLAIKRVLASVGPASAYVFDEVDAGVGGAVAEVIGKKLREVAKHSQVICITHLPQISVYGDRHFRVEKAVVKNRTVSKVRQLDPHERLEEIARMLGGMSVTARTRAAAEEMLQGARAN